MFSKTIRPRFSAPLALCATALLSAPVALASPVNLVSNGSFENTSAYYNSNGTQVGTNVSNSNLPGWQVGCGSNASACGYDFIVNANLSTSGFWDNVAGHISTFYSTPGASPDGGNAFMSDGTYQTQPLYQAVAGLNIGDTYTLKFFQASMQQTGFTGASQQAWMVGLGNGTAASGYTIQTSAVMNNPSQGSTGWVSQTMSFVANATNETLVFFATANQGAQPPFLLLDGVSLTDAGPAAAVAEPATIALLGAGIFGMIAIRRRRATA